MLLSPGAEFVRIFIAGLLDRWYALSLFVDHIVKRGNDMEELKSKWRATINNELLQLLELNRENKITQAQLQRLDFLLQQRGQEIDAHIARCFATNKQVA